MAANSPSIVMDRKLIQKMFFEITVWSNGSSVSYSIGGMMKIYL